MRKQIRALAVLSATVVAAGCTSMAGLGDVVGDGGRMGSRSISGEVRSVDARRGRLDVREYSGRTYAVRFDNRTRVVYDQRQYPVSALERGDEVQIRVQYDRNNTAWADRIDVRRSARSTRDRDRDLGNVWGNNRVQRLDGRVERVDTRRDYFVLDRSAGSGVLVYVPRNARREDVRRFERLRRGERVRVEVRTRSRNEVELVRFR